MSVVSYRLYCEECDNETVVTESERRRDTVWKVSSLMSNKGMCPSCNPTVNLDELDDGDAYHESVDLRSLDGIGEKAATNLERAGYDTVEEIASATDEELLDVSWVGETALRSLKQRAKTLDPQKRWADT